MRSASRPGVRPTICLSGRSTCEKAYIKHLTQNKERCLLFVLTAFFVPNFSIVSSVNSFAIRQGVFMVPQREISNYFSTLRINTLIEKPPYPQENGERGVIHVLIYPQN
ncbi:hypothetical protein GLOIN_2v1778209 [Rhizophagus clarus]|uniref:Uncharacterized protein n=1 Tax=Rhizophagus clarus TaxID=94130 RepID=A0A8H3LX13_9GLOM|nr:hypothetical protein GLOIN_2v1778209 [Rhizophagus clarus]